VTVVLKLLPRRKRAKPVQHFLLRKAEWPLLLARVFRVSEADTYLTLPRPFRFNPVS